MISPTVHDPTNPLRNQDRVESSGSSHLRASDQRRHAVKVVHEHGDMVLQNPVGLSHGSMHGSRPISIMDFVTGPEGPSPTEWNSQV